MRAMMHLGLVALCLISVSGRTWAQNEPPALDALVPAAPVAPAEASEPSEEGLPSAEPPGEAKAVKATAPANTEPAVASEELAEPEEAAPPAATGLEARINAKFGKYVVDPIAKVFFFDVVFWDNGSVHDVAVPFVVLWLVMGAIFFTIRMGFINVRGFVHAIQIVRGKYDNPDDVGEVSHFQALTAALSATVGLGNIGGVAIAIGTGGPGATFWMMMAGFLGMASKFTECTLAQKYRSVDADGTVLGGPMMYLSRGLAEINFPKLGKVLAVVFVVLCIGGSFGGGTSYQVNQSLGAIEQKIPFLKDHHWVYGAVMAALVGVVIIGGIRRIATMAEAIVPLMCGIYVAAAMYILIINAGAVPAALSLIVTSAFSLKAGLGGLLGVLIMGFKRAAFSNEAGVGSAAIAHAAAKTQFPVQEGIVALLEPFVDTIVVCTMTALVIVIAGGYSSNPNLDPHWAHLIATNNGAGLTSMAMGSEISWFPWILAVAVALFAYSTMISWSYYGERCWTWAFGPNSGRYYRVIVLIFVFLGSILTGTTVLDFGDLMILGMALPNVLGLFMLSPIVRRELDEYMAKIKSGEVKPQEG